ncbi:MAG: serine hydrolase [bacterium]
MKSTFTDQYRDRVVQNLLPTTAFDGKFAPSATIEERMAYYHTPGVSIAIIDDYEISWTAGFGVADANSTRLVTPNTLFQVGSISKPIFTLAVMHLVQEGIVDLDADVNSYLISWRIPENEGWQPRITLRHLLSHTSGLTVQMFPGYFYTEPLPSIVQILNGAPPANTPKVEANIFPGIQFCYSGGGMVVAQQVLVDLLGKPFTEIMRELVLTPLGMHDSTYEQPLPAHRAQHAATAHLWKGVPLPGKWYCYPEMAAAGLWTTASDLAKVGVELMGVLQEKKAPRLLSRHTVKAMLTPQLPDQQEGQHYFGLGFECDGKDEGFYFSHSGWTEGYITQLRFYPNLGKGAVIMINSNEGYPLHDEIIRSIAKEYQWPDVFPESKTPYALTQLDGYLGTYLTPTGLSMVVTLNDTHLMLQLAKQPPIRIVPTSELEFTIPILNASVVFEKDNNGQIISLTLTQPGKQIKARKQ